MTEVVGVKFVKGGKVYYFSPENRPIGAGMDVIVETSRGIELGEVESPNMFVEDDKVVQPLRKVLRIATPEDLRIAKQNRQKEKEALVICQKKADEHKLDMKIVDVEYTFDGSKIVFSFTAEGRVDFRELVKELAGIFHVRIELRQIGVRDEAKMIGGLGICGRPFCCSSFLEEFHPVSIKMAKEQGLSLSPTKISGTCGRLMCCLKYEQEAYAHLLKTTPKTGSIVKTPDGEGTVLEVNLLRRTLKVLLSSSNETVAKYYPVDNVTVLRAGKAKLKKTQEEVWASMEVFNSRDERYRNPLGAVPSGTVVRISAFPERERFPIRGFLCVEYEQSGERKELKMAHFGTQENRENFTVLLDTTGYVGLIWYHFRFENDGGYFYYGNNFSKLGGRAAFYGATAPLSYQLTVYDGSHQTIDWFGDGICYHIFPDRFARTEVPKASDYADRSRIIHEDWNDVPLFQPEPNGEITNRDFFGGSIAGVLQKLDYLESLGVTCLYFSPIFEAFSNHRYDTANYERIDPMFGTEEEFSELCRQADTRGIRILLDGVFNHTGFDSLYFNGLGRYPTLGAYQSKESPYYSWYHFDQWPRQYQSWWGIHTLPAVNEADSSYLAFITKSPDSIVRKWLRAGASGWRLDVADELPDSFICEIKKAALAEKPDALIIGEVWEDASNKISYGRRRQYILGGGLDGVMNYPFRTAVLNYLKGGSAEVLVDQIDHLMENYPPYAIRSAMNILGTHDTPRILSLLGMQGHPQHLGKEEQAKQVLSPQERKSAKELLYIASLIQMTMPGAPCIYYGDEVGMEGLEDPLNRRGYIWGQEDMDLLQWYRTLGRLRKKFRSLRQGKLHFRKAEDGLLIFERKYLQERIWVICNRSDQTIKTTLTKLNGPVTDLLTMRELAVSSEGRAFIPPKAAMLVEVESL